MRILDFNDGFTSATEPTVGGVQANGLKTYASDAAFVSAEGTAADGDIYYNTTLNQIRAFIGGAWRDVLSTDRVQIITNKDIDGGTASNTSRITIPSASKTTLDGLTRKSGTIVYASDQSRFYGDNGSALVGIGSGGGGGSSLSWTEAENAPTTTLINNVLHYVFEAGLGQSLYTLVNIPSTYTAGDQVKVRIKFNSADTSGTALMQTVATLIRDSDLVTTTTNQRTSTNSAVTLSGSTQNKNQTVEFDITSATGQINSVSISGQIMTRLTRGTDTSTGPLYVPVYGAEVILNG